MDFGKKTLQYLFSQKWNCLYKESLTHYNDVIMSAMVSHITSLTIV